MTLARHRGFRIAAALIGFAAVTAVTCLIAHPRMFSGFSYYDDEGYMLTALKSFIHRGGLYDDVFTQYGPFFYEFWGGLFSLFGITVTHDAGRTATLVVWMLASLTIALATVRITGSVLLGLATQMLVFTALGVLGNEPMHPGGLICLLLAAIVVIASLVGPRFSPGTMGLLGATLAALILVKINVGFFALVAVALVAVVTFPVLTARCWLRPIVEAGFVALPALLMLSKFGEGWARHYAVHVAAAALTIVIALRARRVARRADEELLWLLAGLLLAGLAICLGIVATGTSVGGLVDGVVRQPLHQSDAFTIPMVFSDQTYMLDLIGLGAACGYWYAVRGREPQAGSGLVMVVSLLSILIGVEMGFSVIGKTLPFDPSAFPGYQLSLLAFAWVALIPVPGESPRAAFARLLLPPLAVLQALHAFPVAGSQLLWGSVLLIPVGAICVANGVRGLAAGLGEPRERRGLAVAGLAAAAVLALFLVNTTLREPLRQSRAEYDSQVPIDLPGLSARVDPRQAAAYHLIVDAIDSRCPAFVMLPGMDSFYFWTGQEPPTGFNATAWATLFDESQQQRVIDDTRSIKGLCLLENIPLAEGWGGRPPGPLMRYLHRGFEPILKVDSYTLLRREAATGS